ncbi:MAG TPA: ABC transporter ATP-binding protein [Kineosporiaceae bacterium]|nr:ABC transporter ATP-binding protein [Kineosporiaceae bacterium]
MPDDLTARPVTGADTLRRGVRVLGRGIRDEPGMFAIAVVGSALYGAGTAGGGWLLGHLTQTVLAPAFSAGEVTAQQLAYVTGSLALVALLTSVGVVVRRAAAGAVMFRLQARYRRAVTRQYLRLPLAWHHRHPAGQLLSNANADVEAIWQVFAPLPMALGVVVMLAVAAAAMLAADPLLGGVGLLVLPAVFAVNVVFQRVMSPRVVLAQQLRASVSAVAHESFEGAVVVKTLGREAAETTRFGGVAGELRDANVAVGVTRGLFDPVLEALPVLGTLAVLVVGTVRVAGGEATTGDVVQVAYLLALVSFPVRALGWVLGELPRTVVGWERVSAVLAARGEMSHGERGLDGGGAAALEVEGVDYAYEGADGERFPVLHGVTVDVAAGSTVAVVGPTGSGKSTLAGLLVRLVDPADGRVLVDGVDLRALRRGELAAHAALVPQGTFVFDDTIRGNVTLGADVDDAAVHRALALARADDFVAALPDGLDTRVGERGATLSGGQRQRLALARALVRRPRLLVLDDATSAVDPHVEARILAGLRKMAGPGATGADSTVVVIAYRMATIALADEVVYVERGRVAARGPHAELMRTSEGYRRLVTAYERDAAERAERAAERTDVEGTDAEGAGEDVTEGVA